MTDTSTDLLNHRDDVRRRWDREFHDFETIKVQGGAQAVKYKEALNAAHAAGLLTLRSTELPALCRFDNDTGLMTYAAARAVATFENPNDPDNPYVFEALGDAHADSVTGMIKPHLFRMAGTRAKSRALQDALNINANMVEEFGDAPDSGTSNRSGSSGPKKTPPKAKPGKSRNKRGKSGPGKKSKRSSQGNPKNKQRPKRKMRGKMDLDAPKANGPGGTYVCEECGGELDDAGGVDAGQQAAISLRSNDAILCQSCS